MITTFISDGIIRVKDYGVVLKMSCRIHPFLDHDLVIDMLSSHPYKGYDHFRMMNIMFL